MTSLASSERLDAIDAIDAIATTQGQALAPPSFEEVYDAHVDFLWRSARGLGVPSTSVEDVLQDVFVVVHRRLPEFRGERVRPWLARILLHVVQEHRWRFRRKEDHASLTIDVPAGASARPDEAVARAEAVRLLAEILDALPEDQRAVFVLHEVEQLPVPEIAAALEVSPNTIYSRLRLARAEYQRQLARVRARDTWRSP